MKPSGSTLQHVHIRLSFSYADPCETLRLGDAALHLPPEVGSGVPLRRKPTHRLLSYPESNRVSDPLLCSPLLSFTSLPVAMPSPSLLGF